MTVNPSGTAHRPAGTALLLAAGLTLLLFGHGGCASPAGVIFPPLSDAPTWPGGVERPRIRYVGELATSADLKPAVSFGQSLGGFLFGKKNIFSMLSPYALCTDGDERLFVADSNAQIVHVFDLGNHAYAQWRPGDKKAHFGQPVGIAYDPAGKLYVADSVDACLHVFDGAGNYLGTTANGIVQRPAGLAFDRQGRRLFVADVLAHQVVVLDSHGGLLGRLGERGAGEGQFNFPTNVAVDGQGRLYVSDSLNFRVQQYDAQLQFVRQIGRKGDMPGYFAQPKGLSVDSEGHVYVVDANFETVQLFTDDGRLLMDFGTEGRAPGEFWLPAGIYIDAGDRIWVADTYNRRVQVFDYLPEVLP